MLARELGRGAFSIVKLGVNKVSVKCSIVQYRVVRDCLVYRLSFEQIAE